MQNIVEISNNLIDEYLGNTSPVNEHSHLETNDPFLNNDAIVNNKESISENKLRQMIDDRNIYQQQINNFYNLIQKNRKLIKDLEKEIYKNCQHDWIRDECANFDDRCKFICSKCSLYRSNYLYC